MSCSTSDHFPAIYLEVAKITIIDNSVVSFCNFNKREKCFSPLCECLSGIFCRFIKESGVPGYIPSKVG